jgi:L-rhamnose-H+ transport protein
VNPILGVVFHAIGGVAAGSFYAPCKRVKGWAWETYWLVLGVFAWIAVPLLMALVIMPNFFEIYTAVQPKVVFWAYIFGLLWGIGGLSYGLSMRYLGMSLGVSVALGFCAMFGTLIPPMYEQYFGTEGSDAVTFMDLLTNTSGQVTLAGIGVCLIGIIICGKAGMMKEKGLTAEQKAEIIKEFDFAKGIVVAIFAGILSACMAFAFTAGEPIQDMAIELGLRPVLSNIPLLVIVLLGGFTTNCFWCLWLSFKNKTFADYSTAPNGNLLLNYILCIIAGTLWYFQFFFYGMGSTQMGKYGFSSWTLHMAFIIVTSNTIGLLTHEWKGSSKNTIRCVLAGITILILSTIIVGFGNKLGAATAQ